MNRLFIAVLLCAAAPLGVHAQEATSHAAATASPESAPAIAPQATAIRLPGNTSVTLSLNAPLHSKSNLTGEKFSLTVAQDIMVDGRIVIPRGTRAVGQINWSKSNGSFGKSGKMDLIFRYIDLNGRQIPLEGRYYQEGQGNSAATVGAVLGAGVIGGLVVKGHSVQLAEGREFTVTIPNDVLFVSSDGGKTVALDAAYNPAPVSMQVETENERKARFKAAKN